MIYLKQNREFGRLAISEVFAYFDGPRLFVAENAAGQRYLVNSIDSDSNTDTWLVVALSDRRLLQLSERVMDVRTAFLRPEMETLFQVVTTSSQELVSSTLMLAEELTDDLLPEPEVFLKSASKQDAPNAAFLAKSLDAAIVLLHLFPNQARHEAPLKGVGQIFASFQDYLDMKLKGFQSLAQDAFRVELLGTFAGSLGVEIAVRGSDERIAPALKAAVAEFELADEHGFVDRMKMASNEEVAAVRRFMTHLATVKSGLEIEAASQEDSEPYRIKADLSRLRQAAKSLSRPRQVDREIRTVTGDLLALNLRTKRFEIVELETGESIAGTLSSGLFSQEQTAELPRRYRVVVERDITMTTSGKVGARAWKLVSATKLF